MDIRNEGKTASSMVSTGLCPFTFFFDCLEFDVAGKPVSFAVAQADSLTSVTAQESRTSLWGHDRKCE